MSRILRRPMFRGGRVNSYGTGIASGLADGGRVGFRTGGSYLTLPDPVTSNPIGRNTIQTLPTDMGILSFKDLFKPVGRNPDGSLKPFTPFRDKEKEGLANIEDYEEVDISAFTPRYVSADNVATDAVEKVETETEKVDDPSLGDTGIATETIADFKEEIPGKKKIEVKTPDPNETDEAEVTMTDLEKALGLDDAKREYASDALAAASKAFFEGRGFEAISDAAQVKSKAPEIKRLAALEEFKAKKAKDLYKTKLEAQAKQKEGTTGALQKDIDFIKSQPEGSQGQILALKKFGFEPDIGSELSSRRMEGLKANLTQLGTLYFPQTFKGVISADTQPKVDGTYILEDASALIIVSGGESSIQTLK